MENNIMKFFVELVGTFIFLAVIISSGTLLSSSVAPLAIGLTLTAMIYFGGNITGGNFNPAVSFMLWINKQLSNIEIIYYITAQIIGAILAFVFYKYISNKKNNKNKK